MKKWPRSWVPGIIMKPLFPNHNYWATRPAADIPRAVIELSNFGDISLVILSASPRRYQTTLKCLWKISVVLSVMMTLSNGNIFRVTGPLHSPVTGEFPTQRPVTRSFDVSLDLRLNHHLSKQWRRRWFKTPLCSLSRHCNVAHWKFVHLK